MIFRDEIKKLTKQELVEILECIDYSLNISQEEGSFCELMNCIKVFIPHDFAICGLVEVEKKALSRVKEVVKIIFKLPTRLCEHIYQLSNPKYGQKLIKEILALI